ALAAIVLCLGVGFMAARRMGATVGLFAGLIQATSAWLVLRGRLAEVDVMLAALIVATMAALDRLRSLPVGRASLPAFSDPNAFVGGRGRPPHCHVPVSYPPFNNLPYADPAPARSDWPR
ncbi:MAG: arnT 5, partial [Planctomycetota bacterium]|nr:arnT 5 [Planctomycetota bacterium]